MSDRTETVLANIDDTLDGANDDWDVSSDAMRWTPPSGEAPSPDNEEESLNDVIDRAIDAAANEGMDRVAHILATQPHTARAVHEALAREQFLDTLTATVPDQVDAYLDACDNDPRIAVEYASFGIPPNMVRDLRETGLTAVQAAMIVHVPENTDRRPQ